MGYVHSRQIDKEWLTDYNNSLPHGSFDNLMPEKFIHQEQGNSQLTMGQ